MMRLSDYSPNPRDVDDLEWRFNGEAEAEMGLRSNMAGFVSLIERGLGNAGGADVDIDHRAVAAATRARLIDRALAGAGPVRGHRAAELARLHFGTPAPGYMLGPGLPTRHFTPVLALLEEAAAHHRRSRSARPLQEWLQRLDAKLAQGRASRVDEAKGAALRRLSEGVVAEIVNAYSAARAGRRRAA